MGCPIFPAQKRNFSTTENSRFAFWCFQQLQPACIGEDYILSPLNLGLCHLGCFRPSADNGPYFFFFSYFIFLKCQWQGGEGAPFPKQRNSPQAREARPSSKGEIDESLHIIRTKINILQWQKAPAKAAREGRCEVFPVSYAMQISLPCRALLHFKQKGGGRQGGGRKRRREQ